MDEGAGEEEVVVVELVVCAWVGQCNRLGASFLPDWCWLWEDAGRFFLMVVERHGGSGGRWTCTWVKEKRNKCVAFDIIYDRK